VKNGYATKSFFIFKGLRSHCSQWLRTQMLSKDHTVIIIVERS